MEKIKEAATQLNNIKRLSIVDSIDSLYLSTYDHNEKLVSYENQSKSNLDIPAFLQDKVQHYGTIDYRLYYTSLDYEILPREMFLYGNEENYLRNILPLNKKGTIHFTDKCAEEKLVIIYPVNALYDIKIREVIRGLHTFHISTPILKSISISDNILYCYIFSNQVFYLLKEKGKWVANYSCLLTHGLSDSLEKQYRLYSDRVKNLTLAGNIGIEELENLKMEHDFISGESMTYAENTHHIKF